MSLENNFNCWFHYVNDTFVVVDENIDLPDLIILINSTGAYIQFTYELKHDKALFWYFDF